MRKKISFLVILVSVFGVNYTNASECIDNDCELSPVIVTEEIEETEVSETPDVLEPREFNESVWATDTKEQSESIKTESKAECESAPTYVCPFESEEECAIWRDKPVYKQAVNPREPHINTMKIDDIIYALNMNVNASANEAVFAPLIERYQMLMRASKACCTDGILYKLRARNASDKQIYQFLKDDANYFAVGTHCLVMGDYDLSEKYSNGVTGDMVSDVRNACLCKNRKWFNALLSPFVDVYNRVPEFVSAQFQYDYTDSLKRDITVSVNQDVQNAIDTLNACPD